MSASAATTGLSAGNATSLRIALPDDLLQSFEMQAVILGIEVEEAIVRHLARTRNYQDEDGLWLTGREAKSMRLMLGGRINTGEKLLGMLKRLTSWQVAGQKVEISPARQEVIAAYAQSMQQKVEDVVPMLVDQALGMRLKC